MVLTRKQRKIEEDQLTSEIIHQISKLESAYPKTLVKRACYKYLHAILAKNKAETEIKALELKLARAKALLQ